MIVASITFLPALLAMVKHRVDTTTRAALIALIAFVSFAFVALLQHNLQIFFAGLIATVAIMLLSFVVKPLRQPIKHRAKKTKELTFWYRWSRFIQRRPWTAAISAQATTPKSRRCARHMT
jgi:RND superfamily putative drug exporter